MSLSPYNYRTWLKQSVNNIVHMTILDQRYRVCGAGSATGNKKCFDACLYLSFVSWLRVLGKNRLSLPLSLSAGRPTASFPLRKRPFAPSVVRLSEPSRSPFVFALTSSPLSFPAPSAPPPATLLTFSAAAVVAAAPPPCARGRFSSRYPKLLLWRRRRPEQRRQRGGLCSLPYLPPLFVERWRPPSRRAEDPGKLPY